jgi:pentose-5-phosphate-3-epimerase
MQNKKPLLAASLICSNPLNIENDLNELLKGGIDYIHFDVTNLVAFNFAFFLLI